MNYLIRGGEFNNKGAEAMTLTALKHIIENDRTANVYMIDYSTPQPYVFYTNLSVVYFPTFIINELLDKKSCADYISELKDFIKLFVPGKISTFGRRREIIRILKSIDIMIDISGFALSSKWDDSKSLDYCDWIGLMNKLGAKVYLMPQSFGPFEYKNKSTLEYVKKTLPLCDMIFAREKQGYNELLNLNLSKVKLSPDSVLLEKDFDPSFIIKNIKAFKYDIQTSNRERKIAIIPNYRLVDQGGFKLDALLDFYASCIKKHPDCCFYLLAHAGEDLQICGKIKQMFSKEDNVIMVDKVLPSFVYEKIVANLDFIIASRYHSIIHAYKEGTPAVILGWADKYNEVSLLLGQNQYLIDDFKSNISLEKVDLMFLEYMNEKKVICDRLEEIQKHSCYAFLGKENDNSKN